MAQTEKSDQHKEVPQALVRPFLRDGIYSNPWDTWFEPSPFAIDTLRFLFKLAIAPNFPTSVQVSGSIAKKNKK